MFCTVYHVTTNQGRATALPCHSFFFPPGFFLRRPPIQNPLYHHQRLPVLQLGPPFRMSHFTADPQPGFKTQMPLLQDQPERQILDLRNDVPDLLLQIPESLGGGPMFLKNQQSYLSIKQIF